MDLADESVMHEVLRLAKKGRGRVSPNPMVGAVLVRDGQVIARGYHRRFGEHHAEVDAIGRAAGEVKGSSLYVNLEPCSHHGKQPPCTEQIVAAGIKVVVVGGEDPNPLVNGRGLSYLRQKGVQVRTGVLEAECKKVNAGFYKFMQQGLPYITLKIAQTIDGMISGADGNSKWISSSQSRKFTHKLRSENDAILAGIGTVLSDDPGLNVRLVRGRNPRRIVLDSRLRIPLEVTLLNDDNAHETIVATSEAAPAGKAEEIRARGAQVWRLPSCKTGGVQLKALCRKLAEVNVTSLLIEGGSQVFSAFLRSRLVDRLEIFVAPKILGDGLRALPGLNIAGLHDSLQLLDFRTRRVGPDVLLSGILGEAT